MKNLKNKAVMAAAVVAVSIGISVAAAAPAQAATRCTDNAYGYGGYSTCVGYIQTMLNGWADEYGIKHIAVDNSFGKATVNRVKDFQGDSVNPKLQVDGSVGPKTWPVLCADAKTGPSSAARKAASAAGC